MQVGMPLQNALSWLCSAPSCASMLLCITEAPLLTLSLSCTCMYRRLTCSAFAPFHNSHQSGYCTAVSHTALQALLCLQTSSQTRQRHCLLWQKQQRVTSSPQRALSLTARHKPWIRLALPRCCPVGCWPQTVIAHPPDTHVLVIMTTLSGTSCLCCCGFQSVVVHPPGMWG